MVIDILVAVAAGEARMISTRTKDALRAYRDGRHVSKRIRALYPDGVPPEIVEATAGRLGSHLPQCRNLTPQSIAKGRGASIVSRQAKALKAAQAIGRLIADDERRGTEPEHGGDRPPAKRAPAKAAPRGAVDRKAGCPCPGSDQASLKQVIPVSPGRWRGLDRMID